MTALKLRDVHVPLSTEFLWGLKHRETNLILAAAKQRWLAAKSVMTRQGDPADHLLLLWRGRARYFFETPNGKKLILRWITPGDMFGVAALVSRPSTYIVSAETVQDSVVLDWDGPTIRALARRLPQLLENALFVAADYVSWYVAAHGALTSQTARERLAHVLAELAPNIGQKISGGIEVDVTNEELASAANITPYTTSRLISEWQETGAIHKRRGKILLRSAERFFLRVV